MSLGFAQAGFEVIAAFENWPPAAAVYRANFLDHPVLTQDLSDTRATLELIRELAPDLIVGGPPCQDFSSAGKRDESLGRADLTIKFAQLIEAYQPAYFLMENVARAAKSNAFREALGIFNRAGYGLTIQVLDAAYCGAPQLRKRLIVIGSKADSDGFLDAALLNNLRAHPLTLREHFGDQLAFEHYYRHPRSYVRRGVFSVDEPSPTIRGVNRPIPKGYPGHPGDSTAVSDALRPLTTRERALIQTFPPQFALPGSKTDVEQVIGNAVPVALAAYVATHLRQHIRQTTDGN